MAILACVLALTGCPQGHSQHPVGAVAPRGGHSITVRHPLALPNPPVRLLRRFASWICIHSHEAAWDDAGDPYWGGLQMDRGFMATYGGDVIRYHHGGLANVWSPAEQIMVAERAYLSGRGFGPWPSTARMCGFSTGRVAV